ncbi:MAG: hypothetical protein UR94_C0001G0021 [Parcubacteria group bacterium GW2011_GWA2_36_10]|nr:MAG: hypothetical protein UR94_C0001G0021 [Parcubacteria group bacterium GW2011_GWA2_36_10]
MDQQGIKKIYNKIVIDKYKNDYEYNRWFATPLLQAGFQMMLLIIKKHVLQIEPAINNILELGPGAGTWTKMLQAKFCGANFDLVDISKEMLDLSKKVFGEEKFSYFESDFLAWQTDKTYDLFFSSRVLEYFPKKTPVLTKIFSLLNHDKYGFIITKNPQYWRYHILGKKIPIMHRQQIRPKDLRKLLVKIGFVNIEFYPAVMTFPIFKSVFINNLIFNLFSNFQLNIISQLFTEAYIVKFKKQ